MKSEFGCRIINYTLSSEVSLWYLLQLRTGNGDTIKGQEEKVKFFVG